MVEQVHHVGADRDAAADRTDIEPGLWDALIADSEVVHVNAGEPIYVAGPPPPVVAILSGSARVYVVAADGQQFTFRYVGEGEMIGLGPLLGGLRTSSAKALTDTTAAIIPLDRVRRVAFQHPALSWTIATEMARWASNAVSAVTEAARSSVTARVARHLLEISAPTPRGNAAGVTHQRLADSVGSSREVVTRALGVLRRAGVVETSPGWVIITDGPRLALIARGDETLHRQS
ncbi:MAG: Crp/Fnr family transcriptional regulator [Candidatus Dormibacter sp.]